MKYMAHAVRIVIYFAILWSLCSHVRALEGDVSSDRFHAAIDDAGNHLCAIDTASSSSLVRSKLEECFSGCGLYDNCSSFNYVKATNRQRRPTCDLYNYTPAAYNVDPDCVFYAVGSIS